MLLRRLSQAVPWPAAAAPLALPAPPFLAAVASHQVRDAGSGPAARPRPLAVLQRPCLSLLTRRRRHRRRRCTLQLQSSATQRGMGEEALSSGHVPERTAPDASNTVHLPEEGEEAKAFDRAADLYLVSNW